MDVLKRRTWWLCLLFFLLHQCFEKIFNWHWVWADNYLDTLLCMPILLGLLLFERRFWLQEPSYCFPLLDTIVMVSLLSIFYEEGFPRISNRFTKDYWDYCCYFVGGLYFYFFVNTNVLYTRHRIFYKKQR